MSISVGSNLNFEGRIYSSADLHAAAIVWADRRVTIETLLVREYPDLAPEKVRSIISGVHLYLTCNENLFRTLEGQKA